ncbi:MAG: zinc-dependent alcohol dehydrogenase [Promethearchaeota archaeon]|jgi:threonine dehydrogenase-like Zn-dependent dehydrogenase
MMKAAVFYGPRDIRMEEVDKPKIEDNEILVNVKAAGICGSDLHMYRSGIFTEFLIKPLENGGIPCHEFSGMVEEVGDKVSGIEIGDRVAAIYMGGMAEYVSLPVFPGFNVHKLPSEVSYEEAATLEPLGNSIHAMLKANPANGHNIVIFGAGTIGLGVVQCLRAHEINLNKLIVVDLSDFRLNRAKQLGADEIINVSKESLESKVYEYVGTVPTMLAPMRMVPNLAVDISYDCVGSIKNIPGPSVLQQAFNITREMTGKVVVVGIFEEDVSLNLLPMIGKQITTFGSYGYIPMDLQHGLELMKTKKLDRSKVITHEFPLDQVKEAFETSCKTDESIKVLVKP